MIADNVPNDWWPEVLLPLASEVPLAGEHVVVAEIGRPWGDRSYRHLFTALAPSPLSDAILANPGGIGDRVNASGPHPAAHPSRETPWYTPRFFIEAGGLHPAGLEPLAVAWSSANRTYVGPDQGFLMTYGLIPRVVSAAQGDEIHWDDPSVPKPDVAIALPVSAYDFPKITLAQLRVHREYLQDYATIRGMHLIQVYFAECWQDPPSDMEATFLSIGGKPIQLPGREIRLFRQEKPPSYLVQVSGTRFLLAPASSPITEGRWQYGDLEWPGIQGPVTHERAMAIGLRDAFVSDAVLSRYEGRPEFSIHPETGGVAYGGQWSTGNTHRVARDLIAVELKKLYEGCPPEVVHQYHLHAVAPPIGQPDVLRTHPNVATRARRITYGLLQLGEHLATLASIALARPLTSTETVGLSRQQLDYEGWWLNRYAEAISRHAPATMSVDDFLSRSGLLDQLVVEALREALLREFILELGVDPKGIVDLKSIKLLALILKFAALANEAHLRLIQESTQILIREPDYAPPSSLARSVELPVLRILHDLRITRGHRTDTRRPSTIDNALSTIGVDPRSTATGWGSALDALYDAVAEEVEGASLVLQEAIGRIP